LLIESLPSLETPDAAFSAAYDYSNTNALVRLKTLQEEGQKQLNSVMLKREGVEQVRSLDGEVTYFRPYIRYFSDQLLFIFKDF
jgi:hypothetical protein